MLPGTDSLAGNEGSALPSVGLPVLPPSLRSVGATIPALVGCLPRTAEG